MSDAVDVILAQWRAERPDLDTGPMGLIGRLGRCAAALRAAHEAVFAEFGLNNGEFDVLATLRRSGPPFQLSPTALFSALMITSGTMTHRLQRLEKAGWITRRPAVGDGRSLLVELTPAGFTLIDQAVTAHVANQHRLLAGLSTDDRQALDQGLRGLLALVPSPMQER